jgi:uncharacterized protein (DUF1800 family)
VKVINLPPDARMQRIVRMVSRGPSSEGPGLSRAGRGYTQQDVIEVAKTLTGWTIDRPDEGSVYKFEERRHEPGTKKVLGKKIKENGEAEGRQAKAGSRFGEG